MTSSLEKPRLLIVEDERDIRDMLFLRLRDAYEIVTCGSQVESFAQLTANTFDVVLLDLRLPVRAEDPRPDNNVGLDILEQIRKRNLRQRNSTRVLPVVVMTAHGSEQTSVHVLVGLGANNYVPKPFGSGDELEQKIGRAIAGVGGLVPAANVMGGMFLVEIDPDGKGIRIDSFQYRNDHFQLLKILVDHHARSIGELLPWEDHHSIAGRALADRLELSEETMRRRIARLRKQIAEDFLKLGRTVDTNDIIENERRWLGYRLNPRTVHVVRVRAVVTASSS